MESIKNYVTVFLIGFLVTRSMLHAVPVVAERMQVEAVTGQVETNPGPTSENVSLQGLEGVDTYPIDAIADGGSPNDETLFAETDSNDAAVPLRIIPEASGFNPHTGAFEIAWQSSPNTETEQSLYRVFASESVENLLLIDSPEVLIEGVELLDEVPANTEGNITTYTDFTAVPQRFYKIVLATPLTLRY